MIRIRQIVFAVVLAVAAGLFLESATAILYRLFRGGPFPRQEYAAQIAAFAAVRSDTSPTNKIYDGGFRMFRYVEVLHPYLGYVRDPVLNTNVNEYGYLGTSDPAQRRRAGRLIVGIFGGSFAGGVYMDARDSLARALHTTSEVVVVNCAVGGYKQPQQALELVYLLAAGAEFDVVINIDGFNDLALPIAENIPKGVNPLFPQAWFYRAGGAPDPDELAKIGRLTLLREQRATWARRFACRWLQQSRVACALWKTVDARMESDMARLRVSIAGAASTGQPYAVTGPPFAATDEASTCAYLAQVWKTSSLQMDALCRANGARYLHFLQPNQYIDGSKPMGDAERAAAFDPNHPYRQPVVDGYPHLRRAGDELAAAGVAFRDLTGVFENHPEPLYIDTCCHVSPDGYRIVAEAIGAAVAAEVIRIQ